MRMTDELMLRRKWTLRAHGRQVVFIKRSNERAAHVIMKALIWALYLPAYPDLGIEIDIGDKYRPDVVELDADGVPRFWGEAGEVGKAKLHALARRYRATHFVIGKWDMRLDALTGLVGGALEGVTRAAPFDLIAFPADSAERFIDAKGHITITFDDLTRVRLGPGGGD
jgi:hypothetical protein